MKVISILSFSLLFYPACLGWVVRGPLSRTTSFLASAHRDTFEEINKELQELGDTIKSKLTKDFEEGHGIIDVNEYNRVRTELLEQRAKVVDLQHRLEETSERLEDLRVVHIVTSREVILGQRARKKELNSVRFLLKSLYDLVGHRMKNSLKFVFKRRWRLHAKSIRNKKDHSKPTEKN